jgi:hypothetical protein
MLVQHTNQGTNFQAREPKMTDQPRNPFEIQNLSSETLKALIASTNPFGASQKEASLAHQELERRRTQIGRIEFKSAGATRKLEG